MNDWQPIGTAPTDGTLVLVSDGERVWASSQRSWILSKDGMPLDGYDWYYLPPAKYPTHWMRIAAPPSGSPRDEPET